ncbi:MAG: class I SAM-dependent methyltransferase [Syntrophomonadaceae bacterium]|nr:class I SAM-dependent methyltransferase [Syntrophomonadaceae bacterium]
MAKKENGFFDFIAPIYGLLFNYQVQYYEKILHRVKNEIDLTKYDNIIDVGCGTGALCYILSKTGLKVTGVDAVQRMINIAEKKLQNKTVDLVRTNVLKKTPFEDKSFDLAISSYVVHGLKKHERKKIYAEMSRITRRMVIYHDYNQNRALHINIAEWLEGGDYFNFIQNAQKEMAESFKKVRVINVDSRAAWYICTPY